MNDRRYQCPRCSRAEADKKINARFCSQFSRMLSDKEQKVAKFVFDWFGMKLTRECKWVYKGWNWNCAGFRPA